MRVTRWAAALGIAALSADAESRGDSADACLAAARSEAAKLVVTAADRDKARAFLEKAAARCHDPEANDAVVAFMGALNADRARLARDLFAGTLTLAGYRDAVADRKRKAVMATKAGPPDFSKGDTDGDLVPDPLDRCPRTTYGEPTDEKGCPMRSPTRPGSREEEATFRRYLDHAKVLHNPRCEEAPRPRTPSPLAWGRGPQAVLGTHGFNFAVAKVPAMPAGCELYYEIEIRFIDRGNPGLPEGKHVTITFRDNEDQLSDAVRAVFPLPMPIETPLSPNRTIARLALDREYGRATWRVRAVNGSNRASHWSPTVTQGPASGGVP